MSWQQYHQKLKNRSPRALYLKAVDLFPSQMGEAIDLGCGTGAETVDLLNRGWTVTAIDKEPSCYDIIQSAVDPLISSRLTFVGKSFEELKELPEADFVFSYLSLQFCRDLQEQDRIWSLIRNSLRAHGVFAGSFLGPKDDWVKSGQCVGVTEENLSEYLQGFEVLYRRDEDRLGPTALEGEKHWHFFELIVRKK